jgi:hypothetical protein
MPAQALGQGCSLPLRSVPKDHRITVIQQLYQGFNGPVTSSHDLLLQLAAETGSFVCGFVVAHLKSFAVIHGGCPEVA